MAALITILGTGKGSWLDVHALLKTGAFEHPLVFIDAWAAKDYRNEYQAALVPIAEDISGGALVDLMQSAIKSHLVTTGNTADFDIALNITSGTGKQHAALIAAVLRLGYGIRLVSVENGEITVLQ